MEINKIFIPQRHIEINKFIYSYKDLLIINFLS